MTQGSRLDSTFAALQAIEANIRAGRLPVAAAALNALRASAAPDVRIFLAEAMLARAAHNPKHEIVALQRAIALASQWPEIHGDLAKALSREGRHDDAVAMANRAVELAPQDLAVLEIAVAIADAAGDFATSQRHLQTALALKPNDIAIMRAQGICLTRLGRYAEAEAMWRAALAGIPDDPIALGWLGMCLIGLERRQEASDVLQRGVALAPDNQSLRFHLALARGETPRTQPREMMQELFDGYASRFDVHLVGQLKYRVPKRVAEIIRARRTTRDVLDLGCGTGLLGVYLGRVDGSFVGVDLSARMIEQAARHNIYTALRVGDLLDELNQAQAESFDYVTANDVFIYVGDVSDVIPAAFKALRSGGALIFSCETADATAEGALILRPSKRYAHSQASMQALCVQAGFERCSIEPIELRLDGNNVPIAGFIAIAEKA